MAIKLRDGTYKCGYCDNKFTNIQDALACKESHNLIYLALSTEELQRLLMFIYSKDERVLGETVVDRLQSYMKGAVNMDLLKVK